MGIALVFIGFVTAIIGDMAALLGWVLGWPDATTAITLVALGTSLPDTFASYMAATQEPYADNSIGNVTGSNSVNVFLGLGLPWLIQAMFWEFMATDNNKEKWAARYDCGDDCDTTAGDSEIASKYIAKEKADNPKNTTDGDNCLSVECVDWGGVQAKFVVPAGALGFSVLVFTAFALMGLGILVARRRVLGYELGGNKKTSHITAAFFVFMWLMYILLSILKINGDIA